MKYSFFRDSGEPIINPSIRRRKHQAILFSIYITDLCSKAETYDDNLATKVLTLWSSALLGKLKEKVKSLNNTDYFIRISNQYRSSVNVEGSLTNISDNLMLMQ